MTARLRIRRLERALSRGFTSQADLDAAIEAELNKMEPEERERFWHEFLREQGLMRGNAAHL